jgi:osmotically-inducible protein OsmY
MKTDSELIGDVTDELSFDPRIAYTTRIIVAADSGSVTLTGAVGAFAEKLAAGEAAYRVSGVNNVDNELAVALATDAIEDEALRTNALHALSLDGLVPVEDIGVRASGGVVTLTGTVPWRYQRDAAEADVARLVGVIDLDDQIAVVNETSSSDVADRINEALARNAELSGSHIEVANHDGTIRLTGTVDTWSQHDEVIDAAWKAPGVLSVVDQVSVVSS